MDLHSIGYSAKNIQIGSDVRKYSRVVVRNPDTQEEFIAGTNEGATLVAECPWASQDLASSLLNKFSRTAYQPYVATDAIISPTAELGDKVTVAGVSSGIFNKDLKFGPLMTTTVSAPEEEELDHEFEYVAKIDRERIRQNRYFTVSLNKVSKSTEEKILEDRRALVAALNGEDGAPEDLKAGFNSYVTWDLKNNKGFASSKLFSQIGEKARAEIGVYVVKSGEQTKTLAQILADQILLQGRVDVTGRLSVEDGGIRVNGNIKASGDVDCGDLTLESKYINLGGNLLTLQGNVIMSADGINLDGKIFSPKEITSTTGMVRVLGIA